jgi:arylsulfatase A-like enzyme
MSGNGCRGQARDCATGLATNDEETTVRQWTTWLAGIITGIFLLVYLNFTDLLVWAASQGALGWASQLRDPIQPNRIVDWQRGPTAAELPAGERAPNIVVILADDLGWNDISFYGGGLGGGAVKTPNIDSIAAGGIHMVNGYTGNATCAPSRAALLTGRYPTRFGFEFTPAPVPMMRLGAGFDSGIERPYRAVLYEDQLDRQPPYSSKGVPGSEIMLPRLLNSRGYHSVIIGKWHLGEDPEQAPTARGFDEFLGFLGGGSAYAARDDENYVESIQDFDPIDRFLWPNLTFAVRYNDGPRFNPDRYMTDYLSSQAVSMIKANRHRPFFLYLAYNAPHTPLHALRADYDALDTIENHTERVYGAMVRSLDRGIGQVLAALKDNGLEENTLVIFSSDNGGAHYVGLPDLNRPYRGWKMTFFEGGIHTPFFVKWPARLPAGGSYDQPVSHIDIFATAAAAAGAEPASDRPIDGVDLVPYLAGEREGPPHASLQWRSGGYRAALAAGWKIQVSDPPGKTWLFNLAQDPTEQRNLAESNPEQRARMEAVLEEGQRDWLEPAWPQSLAAPIAVDHPLNVPGHADEDWVFWAN